MGLELLNRITNPAPVQNSNNSSSCACGASEDALAFQQHLDSQMESRSSEEPGASEETKDPAAGGKDLPRADDTLPDDKTTDAALSPDIMALLAEFSSMGDTTTVVADEVSPETSLDTTNTDDMLLLQIDGQAMQPVSAPKQPIAVDQLTSVDDALSSLTSATKADTNAVTTLLPGVDTSSEAANDEFSNTLASVATNSANAPAAPAAIRNAAASAPPTVNTPVGQQGWDQELGDHIMWMTSKSLNSAEIHLNPPHLGPIDVRVSMNEDQQTNIQFISAHAGVREAIEAAVPRLREMMGEQQLTLVDVNVFNQSPQRQSEGRDGSSRQTAADGFGQELDNDVQTVDTPRMTRVSNGLLSLYA